MTEEQRIRDIITDVIMANVPRDKIVKRGFFAGDYLRALSAKKSKVVLVTEEAVRKHISSGSRTMSITRKSIVTPLARELLDEKNIRVEYE